jgi:hypothetical protein
MDEKREKVLQSGGSSRKIYIGGALVVIIALAIVFLGPGMTGNIAGASELDPMDYSGLRVDKRTVEPVEDGDMIGVKLSDLEEYRMLYFRYQGKPVLVYADQFGSIVASIAMCEPCENDESFFIQDNVLVCGKCFTKWSLGTHTGLSGGCKEYPPEILGHEVRDGNVLVKKSDIINWRPRV